MLKCASSLQEKKTCVLIWCWSFPYENNAHWCLFPIVQNVCYLNRCSAGVALLAWTLLILERIGVVQVWK